jgi:hypothetical protein
VGKKKVKTSVDHIQSLTAASAQKALEELIWNGLDAGGNTVEVRLRLNEHQGLATVEVTDCGPGIPLAEVEDAFGEIGNSRKPKLKANSDGRALVGREGKGRLKAMAFCRQPVWTTVYERDGRHWQYTITISRDAPDNYDVSDEVPVEGVGTGTTVRMADVDESAKDLLREDFRDRLLLRLAFYLSQYPGVSVVFDGVPLDLASLIKDSATLPMPADPGQPAQSVTVLAWHRRVDKKLLYLCDESGFAYHDVPLGVPAPGIELSAYLCSPLVKRWADAGRFAAGDLDPEVQAVLAAVKERLKDHIADRLVVASADVVAEWRDQQIYPYAPEEFHQPLIAAERRVFDMVAVHVDAFHPTFHKADREHKQLTLTLIRKALEGNPSSLSTILRKLIETSAEEQKELADLLERTTVSALIKAGSVVTQRLDTIGAFGHILFDPDWKRVLLERTQLHRLLAHELWLLGEEFELATDDEAMRVVLERHLAILGRAALAPEADVRLIDGREGIPDLMLWHRAKVDRDTYEHLVVELKRPRDALGEGEITQTRRYAHKVATDERFNTSKVRWRFVLLGNDLDDYAQSEASQDGMPPGCIYKKGNVSIWVQRWSDVLEAAKSRYEFFREKLGIQASAAEGMVNWQERFRHLLADRGVRRQKDLEFTRKAAPKPAGQPAKKQPRQPAT